ncbi:hypothetical protein HYH03_011378 [Edaphochlamys debaryana]|uniref:Uncharacterized protein n=1 Tax=Edaphochlamys debaryana TaxID=47281 RepID=A0A836BWL9_9CHLO|nr:hypothetical protein HYH03_011378 [Edaphochlamys debaryana]|eukprot:KAG2490254.1 hypothetical protein HYH03_011378 [Edaphochlamys debaryana]
MEPSRLVVGVDGFDDVLSRAATAREFATRFSYFGTEFVWSGEVNMFPAFRELPPEVQQYYPSYWHNETGVPEAWLGLPKEVPYPFLNFGGWVGTAGRAALVMKAVHDLLRCTLHPKAAAAEQPQPAEGASPAPENATYCPPHDQAAAQIVLVSDVCRTPGDEGAKCMLDMYGQVFFSGYPSCEGLIPRIDGYWWNSKSGTTPLTVHYNGMAKGTCFETGAGEYMQSRRTGWFNRVDVSPDTPVQVTRASFHGDGLLETHNHTFGELCPGFKGQGLPW